MKNYLLALLLLCPALTLAQDFIWNVDFDTRFDNREYASIDNSLSQTLFSGRLSPGVGVKWNDNNSIIAGVDLWSDFGAEFGSISPDVFFYYRYESEKFSALAGVLPRAKVLGEYNTAFFSDSVRYYHNNLSGLLLQHKAERGYIELALNWNSHQSKEKREKFMIFSSAQHQRGLFFGGYNFLMYHFAGSKTIGGVIDNLLVQPYLGVDFSSKSWFDMLKIKASWMNAFQNDRKYVGEWVTPGGYEINLQLEKYKFGIENSFYHGSSLMPYYASYGGELYLGDVFYSKSGIYNRLEVYWHPISTERMDIKVSSIHHFYDNKWGSQQKASLIVTIGKESLSKKKQD